MANESRTALRFEDVYAETASMVLNLAFRMTGSQDVAQDLTQDVFIKVYKNLGEFREQAQVSTWVYRIAMNHIINWVKREKRMRFFSTLEKDVKEAETESSWLEENTPQSPSKQLEEHEKEVIIRKMIDRLSPKYRLPLLLYRYEDLSYKEIAGQMDLSLSAVEARIHRARKKLKEYLKPWLEYF